MKREEKILIIACLQYSSNSFKKFIEYSFWFSDLSMDVQNMHSNEMHFNLKDD